MPHARRKLGNRGELIAERFLAERGYTLLERGYTCREGEIDLVCRDGDTLAFIEVKTRRGTAFGIPEEAVTAQKLSHIEGACLHYLQQQPEGQPWRIDVVAVQLDTMGRVLDVRLIANAADW